jgi:hypothetical protein
LYVTQVDLVKHWLEILSIERKLTPCPGKRP